MYKRESKLYFSRLHNKFWCFVLLTILKVDISSILMNVAKHLNSVKLNIQGPEETVNYFII